MAVKIVSVGFEIPDVEEVSILKNKSLDDYDVVFFDLNAINHELDFEDKISFANGDVTLGEENSKVAAAYFEHWEREIELALDAGKVVIAMACQNNEIKYAKKVRDDSQGWHIFKKKAYDVLKVGNLISCVLEGKNINAKPSDIQNLLVPLLQYISYSVSFENCLETKSLQPVLETRGGRPVGLWGTCGKKHGKLLIIPKPALERGFSDPFSSPFSEQSKVVGKVLVKLASDLYCSDADGTEIPPEWVSDEVYRTQSENELNKQIQDIDGKIMRLQKTKNELEGKIKEEHLLKSLLFGKGKVLENAVNLALELLGVDAKQYNFFKKDLEIDHLAELDDCVLIGESEGKDNKDIDKNKLSQLLTNKGEYYNEPKVDSSKPVKLLLFGNPMRLKQPSARTLDFTKACKDIAKNNQVSLIKTTDLFNVVTFVKDTGNKKFARSCLNAILKNEYGVVTFPQIPKGKKYNNQTKNRG